MLGRRFQAPSLQLRRKYPLQVEPAAEPTSVRWENLDTPATSRLLRRSCTNVLATCLVLATLLFVIFCQVKRDVRALRCVGHRPVTGTGQALGISC